MILDIIKTVINPVTSLIDGLFTSDEEKAEAKRQLKIVENQAMLKALDFEKELITQKSKIIQAEAQGTSWLQRNWRPILMLTFTAIVVARWFGLTPIIPESVELKLMDIIEIGIGGYIIGRSAEKVIPKAIEGYNNSKRGVE